MHAFCPFAAFVPRSGSSAFGAPDIPAVLLTSDGCYVETADGCLLTVLAREPDTTIETIPPSAFGAPDIPAVLLTSDGCYVETAEGCLLTVLAREPDTTIETIL